MGSPSSLVKSPIEEAATSVDAQDDVHRRRTSSDATSIVAYTAMSHQTDAAADVELGSSPDCLTPTNLTPKASKSRKATRKPVPLYDSSVVPRPISSARTLPAPPLSEESRFGTFDAGLSFARPQTAVVHKPDVANPFFARPQTAVIHKGSASSLNVLAGFNAAVAGGNAHYVSRTHSQRGDRELNHKSSLGGFEGRPMHYLIPDMPLPQK
jgi:hypothetical protein